MGRPFSAEDGAVSGMPLSFDGASLFGEVSLFVFLPLLVIVPPSADLLWLP
jgi:hypothetical protein